MPETLKDKNGDANWSAIFMGFAMALVLILQQVQTMRIAEIKAVGEVNKESLIHKSDVIEADNKIRSRIKILEEKFK